MALPTRPAQVIKFSKKRRSSGIPPEINVTPFVDVLLVLLIIFMVASPAIVSGLNIELPRGEANHEVMANDKSITVTLDSSNQIFVNDSRISRDGLGVQIDSASDGNKDAIIFLRADRVLQYGAIMSVINDLAKNGYAKIVLVTEDEKGG